MSGRSPAPAHARARRRPRRGKIASRCGAPSFDADDLDALRIAVVRAYQEADAEYGGESGRRCPGAQQCDEYLADADAASEGRRTCRACPYAALNASPDAPDLDAVQAAVSRLAAERDSGYPRPLEQVDAWLYAVLLEYDRRVRDWERAWRRRPGV